jgi:hypothetical protein
MRALQLALRRLFHDDFDAAVLPAPCRRVVRGDRVGVAAALGRHDVGADPALLQVADDGVGALRGEVEIVFDPLLLERRRDRHVVGVPVDDDFDVLQRLQLRHERIELGPAVAGQGPAAGRKGLVGGQGRQVLLRHRRPGDRRRGRRRGLRRRRLRVGTGGQDQRRSPENCRRGGPIAQHRCLPAKGYPAPTAGFAS